MKTIHYLYIILAFVFISFFQFYASGQMQVQFRECLTCNTIGDLSETATYDYGPVQEYQTKKIASDYGPRHLSVNTPYNWHGGVDYNSQKNDEDVNGDKGDLILAIEGGTVYWVVDANYKRIYIDGAEHDFGYGHIFRSGTGFATMRSGGCVLKKMLPPVDEYALIRPDGTAIGEHAGYVLVGNDTIEVSTTVAAGEVVGPMGNSIGSGTVFCHLHLYSFPNGSGNHFSIGDNYTKDPLAFVEHDSPIFEIQILKTDAFNNPPPGFDPVYPGNNASTVKVRVKLPNEGNTNTYNTVYNADSIKVLIKKSHEHGTAFTQIQGPSRRSLFSHGAMIGTTRYNISQTTAGNWTTTGMRPYAYSDTHLRPWDDFYFTDFITRIHKDDPMDGGEAMLSYCPMSTRYNDGRYHLKSRVTNVREQATDSPVQNVVIDDYPQNILNGKYYVLKCLRYLTLSEFYFFFCNIHTIVVVLADGVPVA